MRTKPSGTVIHYKHPSWIHCSVYLHAGKTSNAGIVLFYATSASPPTYYTTRMLGVDEGAHWHAPTPACL